MYFRVWAACVLVAAAGGGLAQQYGGGGGGGGRVAGNVVTFPRSPGSGAASTPTGASYPNSNYPGNTPNQYPGNQYPGNNPTNRYNQTQHHSGGYQGNYPSNYPGNTPVNRYNQSQYPGNNPGNNPSNYPGNNPSQYPSNYPGNNPSNYPGNNPGNYPGNNPGSYHGNNPSNYPGSNGNQYPSNYPGNNPANRYNQSQPHSGGYPGNAGQSRPYVPGTGQGSTGSSDPHRPFPARPGGQTGGQTQYPAGGGYQQPSYNPSYPGQIQGQGGYGQRTNQGGYNASSHLYPSLPNQPYGQYRGY